MAERYSKLFALPGALYTAGAPVIIQAGALLLDTTTAKVLAQVKFQNITDKTVIQLKMNLTRQDAAGKVLGESVLHTYIDINAKRNETFGGKTPVYMPHADTRSFSLCVTEVTFADGSVWQKDVCQWETLPKQKPMAEIVKPELLAEYQRIFGREAAWQPLQTEQVWFCTCGACNHKSEAKCRHCGKELTKLLHCTPERLAATHKKRMEAEKAKQAQIAESNAKKSKILFIAMLGVTIFTMASTLLMYRVNFFLVLLYISCAVVCYAILRPQIKKPLALTAVILYICASGLVIMRQVL